MIELFLIGSVLAIALTVNYMDCDFDEVLSKATWNSAIHTLERIASYLGPTQPEPRINPFQGVTNKGKIDDWIKVQGLLRKTSNYDALSRGEAESVISEIKALASSRGYSLDQ